MSGEFRLNNVIFGLGDFSGLPATNWEARRRRQDWERIHDLRRRAGGSADGQSTRARGAARRGEPVGSV